MKKILKRNQMMIVVLVLMIAAAGYLNYSKLDFLNGKESVETGGGLEEQELLDISEEDLADGSAEMSDIEGEIEGTPGEAVLTNGNSLAVVSQAKITREQMRAKNKETLQKIIDDKNLSEEQKNDAVNKLVSITTLAEKEVAVEMLLAGKGFRDSVVSLTENSADIVVNGKDLSEAKRAQIEDIVTRKTGIRAADIVITPIHTEEGTEKKEDAK